jgi:hypothetical protein
MPDQPVPEPDAFEQRQPVDPADAEEEDRLRELQKNLSRGPAVEAAEADLLEQAEPVDGDEDGEGRFPED